MGISGDKLNRREKKPSLGESPNRVGSVEAERSNTSPLPSTADFGDRSMLIGDLSTSDMMVSRLSLKLTSSHRDQQERSLQRILEKTFANLGQDSAKRPRKYTLEDFKFIKVLGKGSFGKVSSESSFFLRLIKLSSLGYVSGI